MALKLSLVPKLLLFLKSESFNDPQKGSSSSGEEEVKTHIFHWIRELDLSILVDTWTSWATDNHTG